MVRPPLDLSLYLVADTVMCGETGVAATVSAAIGAGVTMVQLRDTGASDDEIVRLGRELQPILVGTGVPLIIDDRPHLVEAIGADGAHVGQLDLDVTEARSLLGATPYLGLSVQTVAHVEAALSHPDGTLDYLGVGPVWGTATKPDAAPPGGPDLLRLITRASPWPCVAIGGLNIARMPEARRAGALGVAVVSAICGQPDVAAATRELRAAWDLAAMWDGVIAWDGPPT